MTWDSRTLGSVSRLGAKSWPHPSESHGAGNHGNSPWQHGLKRPNTCQETQLKGQPGLVSALLSPGKLFPESSTWKHTFLGCPR